jgi:hypothetical protein
LQKGIYVDLFNEFIMLKQSLLILSLVSLLGFVAINGLSVSDVLAQKNGWGKATSEEAREDGRDFGAHASDPTSGDDNPRSGIGNVAEQFTGSKNPSELGNLLDSIDCDDADDDC